MKKNYFHVQLQLSMPLYIYKSTHGGYWQDLLFKSTMDSVFKIVLGVELDTMCGTYEEGTRFSRAFDEASAITILRYIDIFWKFKRFLNIGLEALLKKHVREIDVFVYKVIKSKTEQVQKSEDKPVSFTNPNSLQ